MTPPIAAHGFLELIAFRDEPICLNSIAQLCEHDTPCYVVGEEIHVVFQRPARAPTRFMAMDVSDGIGVIHAPPGDAARLYARLNWPEEWLYMN